MATNEFSTLNQCFTQIKNNGTDIDVKLYDEAQVLHLKLEKELDIRNFIMSVAHVEDYKTIRKSVTVLNKKFKAAEDLGVKIDTNMIQQINECSQRLISERNLRFEMETMHVSAATKDTVEKLQDLIQKAQDW